MMKYRIRELRKRSGMTQDELSKRSGISRATIWKLETREGEITTTGTLVKIADALCVPVDELFLSSRV